MSVWGVVSPNIESDRGHYGNISGDVTNILADAI